MRFHWQNLTKDDGKGKFPRNGRAWWHFNHNRTVRLEWCFSLGFRIGLDLKADENAATFSLQIISPCIYLTLPVPRAFLERILPSEYNEFAGKDFPQDHEIKVYWFEKALWWQIWQSPWEWKSSTPRWRHGSFHFDDFLLGRAKFSERLLVPERSITIPMPDGEYPAKVKRVERQWKRPRWFKAITHASWDFNMEKGIPFPGKGENSWDCGTDGLWGCGSDKEDLSEAVGDVREIVFKNRERYGGSRQWLPTQAA